MVGLLANSGIPPLASGGITEATGGITEEVVGSLKSAHPSGGIPEEVVGSLKIL